MSVSECYPPTRKWCAGMESRVDDDYGRMGLTRMDTFDREAQGIRTVGVQFRDRRHKRPIALNFCPWCGADLRPWLKSAPWKEAPAEVKP